MPDGIQEMAAQIPPSVIFGRRKDSNVATLPEGAQWLASLVDGEATASQIAERSRMPGPQALAGLLYLAQIGVLEVRYSPNGWTPPAAPGAPAKSASTASQAARNEETADDIREGAKAAERDGRPGDALALVERGISVFPNRADLHALRARILVASGRDAGAAAAHALRAAQIEPGNSAYRSMALEYAARAGLPAPALSTHSAPSASSVPAPAEGEANSPTRPRPPNSVNVRLPNSRREWSLASLGILLLAALVGWNVWFWVIRPAAGRPRALDTKAVAAILPLDRLQLLGLTAYGTVTAEWPTLPDREKKIVALAEALASHGAQEVVLSDANNRVVARGKRDGATIFGAKPVPSPKAPAPTKH